MTFTEFTAIAKAIRTYYPREKILPSQEAVTLWYEQVKDLDYKATSYALNKWVATNKWSPSIADLREQVASITKGDALDWGEAWETVRLAIREYGSYNPEGAYSMMDDLTKAVVKRLGFTDLCYSENSAADRANFRTIYEQMAERQKAEKQIPAALLLAIEGIKSKMIEASEKLKEGT